MNLYETLYDGFTKNKGDSKEPAVKYKNRVPLPTDLDTYKNDPASNGRLREGIVMLDFDLQIHAMCFENIIKRLGLQVPTMITERGKHYYFKCDPKYFDRIKDNIKTPIACGLEADIRAGHRNGLDTVKLHGKLREFLNADAELIDLPKFATPLSGKHQFEFLGSKEGDGRNDTLYQYQINLKRDGFTREESEFICKEIINKFVFSQPMSEYELNSIFRAEAWDNIKVDATKLTPNDYALKLMDDFNICNINGTPRFYKDGYYTELEDVDIGLLVTNQTPESKENFVNEVRRKIRYQLRGTPNFEQDTEHLCFKNGLFNIKTKTMLPHTPEVKTVHMIDNNYNPDARCDEVDEALNNIACNDPQLRKLFDQVVGTTLCPSNKHAKCFILVGDGANGKSTFLDLLRRSIGARNVSTLDLKDLQDRFRPSALVNSMVNLGDDISAQYMEDTSIFKKLVTGDPITIERKGKDSFDAELNVKFIFSANDMPRVKNYGDAIKRRLILIPCNARFNKENRQLNINIKEKLNTVEAYEYMLKIAVDNLIELESNDFTYSVSQQVTDLANEYEQECNPLLSFLEDCPFEQWYNQPTAYIYELYNEHCRVSNVKPMGLRLFTRKAKALNNKLTTKPKTIDYKSVRIYAEE